MKKAFSILMILATLLPNLSKIGILIDFKINQDFIAEELCVNREKPMTICNGKCYLSEQLKKAEEQEEKHLPVNKKERLEVVYYCLQNSFDLTSLAENLIGELNSTYNSECYTSSFIADIFRPPQLNLI